MIKLLTKIFVYLIIVFTILAGIYSYLYKIGGDDFPAAYFSNSLSFNEKIEFLKDKNLSKIELIAIGSSMTLNNINSEVIVNDFGYQNYLNLASWGFKITDTEKFMKNMLPYFPNLKRVIISTNLMDFSDLQRNIHVDYSKIRLYLSSDIGCFLQYVPFNLKYLFNNAKKNRIRHLTRNTYQSLEYDAHGGVVLYKRWNKDISQYEISNKEVECLNLLSDLFDRRNIELIVSFSPIRNGMLDDKKRANISRKIEQIKRNIPRSDTQIIEPYTSNNWPDSLFVDFSHLNHAGTKKYTEFIMKSFK